MSYRMLGEGIAMGCLLLFVGVLSVLMLRDLFIRCHISHCKFSALLHIARAVL